MKCFQLRGVVSTIAVLQTLSPEKQWKDTELVQISLPEENDFDEMFWLLFAIEEGCRLGLLMNLTE